MDQKTIAAYNDHANDFRDQYERASGVAKYFARAFPAPGSRILDIGCGSGRDLALLLQAGYEAFGAEPSSGLRIEACHRYPDLNGRIFPWGLPIPPDEKRVGVFSGILCSAVLMHLPREEHPEALKAMCGLLEVNGRLLLSFSETRTDLDHEGRDGLGRLFVSIDPEEMSDLLRKCGFRVEETWKTVDSLGRVGVTWQTLLAVRGEHPLQLS